MKIAPLVALLIIATCHNTAPAQQVDYSVVSVPEERGLNLKKISSDNDYVCMPEVRRTRSGVEWFTNRVLAASPNGKDLGYLSFRNGLTNVFVRNILSSGVSQQRTNRSAILDFSFSPDGSKIAFSEAKGHTNQIFSTDAANGFVCRQITSGDLDYSPVFAPDMRRVFFARQEANGVSIWSYDLDNNMLSTYTSGMNPCLSPDGGFVYVARNNNGLGEIWRINLHTGTEECIISNPEISFYSPALSPDGSTLAMVGGSKIDTETFVYYNTDIYTCRTNGTGMRQITHHAADDVSPTWSTDGTKIFFVSQRGSSNGTANIWQLDYHE